MIVSSIDKHRYNFPKMTILTTLFPPQVDLAKLPSIANWKRDFTMETVLIEIRRYMAAPANKKLPQPPEGTNF
jgi:ubiquitin-protein ligase